MHSPKGGCGVTTLAINLAVAKRLESRANVALVDLSLAYGDVGMMTDLGGTMNIYELNHKLDELDEALLADVMVTHPSGVKVLLAPAQPQQAESITGQHVRQILSQLSMTFDYVFVDTAHDLSDVALVAMDMARAVLLVGTQDVASVRDIKLFLDVAKLLDYPKDKVRLVLNRANGYAALNRAAIQERLDLTAVAVVPEELKPFAEASSRGVPLVMLHRGSPSPRELRRLATTLEAQKLEQDEEEGAVSRPKPVRRSLFSKARA